MNKTNLTKLFLTLSTLIVFTATGFISCKKNTDATPFSPAGSPDLTTQVKSSVSGFVIDENLLPVNLATVQAGTVTATTDKYGYFEVQNADVIKNAAVVTVTKTGYFKGIKTYIAAEGKSAFFRIKLIPKTIAGTVNGATGGIVTLTNGLSITLPSNAVVNATTNATYSGTVNVAAYWLNPTSVNLSSMMPGDLRGLNTAGNLQLLTTYGMAAVELTGSAGEILQIATGKKASISFPIPASLSSSAPATIPLWYFDEAKGLWKEEGAATKTGNNYVGEVNHFSFWNCDVPGNFIQFDCTVKNAAGQPFQNHYVRITVVNTPANNRGGYTDSSGYVSGPVPANTQLRLEIFSTISCSLPIYSQIFSTTNVNISLGIITIPAGASSATVSGTVTSCSNTPVTNGYLYIKRDSIYERHNLSNTGAYSFNLLLCGNTSNSVTFVGVDVTNSQQSPAIIYSIVPGNNSIPNIQACGVSNQQFISFTYNGIPYSHVYPVDSLLHKLENNGPTLYNHVSGTTAGTSIYSSFYYLFENIAPGSIKPIESFYSGIIGEPIYVQSPPILINFTEYGIVGQYISGNFSGTFKGYPPNNIIYNIVCSFRIRRRI